MYTHIYTAQNASLDYDKMCKSVEEMLEKSNGYVNIGCYDMIQKRIIKSGHQGITHAVIKFIERLNVR